MFLRFPFSRDTRMVPLLWLPLIVAASFFLSRESNAQVIDPVVAAQAPVPGAGHHYIGMGAETVNPADGSLTFDLPIQTPAGRGLSFPFGIHYNSSEPFTIPLSPTGAVNWFAPNPAMGQAPPFALGGWSYKLPTYMAQTFLDHSHAAYSGCGDPDGNPCPGHNTDYCWSTQNYNFRGFDGRQYGLDAHFSWADPNNPDPQAGCSTGAYSQGGDGGVAVSMGNSGITNHPPLTVTEKSGTVYQFPSPGNLTSNTSGIPFGLLAQTITDKNGNQIVLNSGQGSYSAGSILTNGSYIDTAGRIVVSWSGLGSHTGDQIAVSGLGNVTVQWTTTTIHLPTISNTLSSTGSSNCEINSNSGITIPAVSEIDLPNGQTYSFSYAGPSGQITKITFPDGGYVTYVWGVNPLSQYTHQVWNLGGGTAGECYATFSTPAIIERDVYDVSGTHLLKQQFSNYTTSWASGSITHVPYWSYKNTIVTSTDLIANEVTTTNYTYTSIGNSDDKYLGASSLGGQVPVEQTVLYQDQSGNTLKTLNHSWADQYTMIGNQMILDNGQGITTLRCVDGYDRVLATYEYDFQNAGSKPADPNCPSIYVFGMSSLSQGLNLSAIGPLLRQTITAFHDFGSTYIKEEPDSVTTYDGSGHQIRQTSYLYDKTATVPSGTVVTSSPGQKTLVSPPGLRGNATSVSHWLNTNNSFLTNTYTYFDTGQVQSMTDSCGNASCPDIAGANHTTLFSYADSFGTGTGSPSGQTNAYLTQVTYPNTGVAHQESYTWGYTDGLLRSHTDQNSQTTNYQFNDPLLRLTETQGPADLNNGNQRPTTTYTYTDWTPTEQTPSSIAKAELENTSGTNITSNSILDGLGRTVRTQATSDTAGVDIVDTVYDGLGHVYTVSNPYRALNDPTYGQTTNFYDALGRKTSQIDSDGISTQVWGYSGSTVTYTNENKNQWQRTTDALGRLSKAMEPSSTSPAPTMETDYAYDLLDNLTSVNQWGGAHGSSGARSRFFSYDSLSRLIQSFNPEAGWTCYGTTGGLAPNGSNCISGYDANGNLAYKTDARMILISYSYDALNRLLSKSFSNDASGTPSSCYQYDVSSFAVAPAYLTGRLANQWTQKGACAAAPPTTGLWARRSILAYDVMGRVLKEQQCTPSNCTSGTPYSPAYTYDLAGNVITSTNGIASTPAATANPLTFTNAFDSAGRLQTLTSNWSDTTHPATLFSAQTGQTTPCQNSWSAPYAPFGGLVNAMYGSGLTLNRAYDKRLRTTCETDTGSIVPTPTSGSATVTITGTEQTN